MFNIKKKAPIISFLTLLFLCVPVIASAEVFEAVVWGIVNTVFGLFVGMAGWLLNIGVQDFVIGFGDQFLSKGAGVAVDALWVNVRDMFNITFIFGLVYLGFKMILNSDDSGTRRWLVNLILAALLVNFSLYITKLIVDFTNILATQIAIGGFGPNPDIAKSFMDALGFNNLLKAGPSAGWAMIFGTMMLYIVGTFVFAAGGLLLIIRYAALCLYMVMSPLMFLGWVFPGMQSVTSDYWKGFLGRAFFAPIYLLLLLFSNTILNQFFQNGQSPQNFVQMFSKPADAFANNAAGFQATISPFILACIFLIASVVVASKLGADGAKQAVDMGNKLKGWGQQKLKNGANRTGRVAAYAPKKAAGWGARKASNGLGNLGNRKLNQWQQSNNRFVRGVAGSVLVDDAVRGGSAALKNKKYGMSDTVDGVAKKKDAITNRVSRNDDIRTGAAAQNINNSYNRSDEALLPGTNQKVARSSVTNPAILKQINDAEIARDKEVAKMQTHINEMSQKDIEDLYESDAALFESVAGNLKTSQSEGLQSSTNLTSTQKADALNKRQKAIATTIEKNGIILTENLTNMSVKQIEEMGDDFIRDNAHLFSQNQMDGILKSDKFTEGQKGGYVGVRKQTQKANAKDPNKVAQLFNHNSSNNPGSHAKKKKAVDIANLPFEVFIDNNSVNIEAIKNVDATVLEEIFSKKTMTVEQRNQLRDAITSTPGANTGAIEYFKTTLGARNWGASGSSTPTTNSSRIDTSGDTGSALRDTGRG